MEKFCLVSLYADSPFQQGSIYMDFGVYEIRNGREEWTGEAIEGHIPPSDLLALGLEKGFLRIRKEAQ